MEALLVIAALFALLAFPIAVLVHLASLRGSVERTNQLLSRVSSDLADVRRDVWHVMPPLGKAGPPPGGAGERSEPEGVSPAASGGASAPSEPPFVAPLPEAPPPEEDYEDLPPDDL